MADAADTFASAVASSTGLSPLVVKAWMRAEGAYAPNGTGHYNFLNLRAKGATGYSGVTTGRSSGGFAQFSSVDDAARETSWWINHMSNYAGIRRAAKAKASDGTQLRAIAASPWDAGHYTVDGRQGRGLSLAYVAVAKASKGGGSWLGDVAGGVGDVAGAVGHTVAHPIDAIQDTARAATEPVAGAITWLGKELVMLVAFAAVLALAAALFYNGIRRLSGDRLPSGRDVADAASTAAAARGGSTAAAAA